MSRSSCSEVAPWEELPERITDKIHEMPYCGCWVWAGCLNESGYGMVGVGHKVKRVHRVVWESLRGPIPEGLGLLHSCHNPACCNPDHLRPGNQRENWEDSVKDGTNTVPPIHLGESNVNAKMNPEKVRLIRARAAMGYSGVQIAGEMGIHLSTACRIIKRVTWGHVL